MRYRDLHRLYAAVPVTSPPVRRHAPIEPPALPPAGERWGKGSRFSWSRQAAGQGEGMSLDRAEPRAFMRVVEAQAKIMSERARVESPDDPSVWAEVDRMTRMAFAYTEFPPKRYVGSPQPSRTKVFDLALDLHPPAEDEAVVP